MDDGPGDPRRRRRTGKGGSLTVCMSPIFQAPMSPSIVVANLNMRCWAVVVQFRGGNKEQLPRVGAALAD
jgi:hypothetical protein